MTGKVSSYQDFSLIHTTVSKYATDYNQTVINAFYYFTLDMVLSLQDDEIIDSITDTNYLMVNNGDKGHDRGIDAIFIDDSSSKKPVVHFFNCKYTEKYENVNRNFPSGEIDKVCNFIRAIMNKDKYLAETVNPVLHAKVVEIWELWRTGFDTEFKIHLCSNYAQPMEKQEDKRLKDDLSQFRNMSVEYHLLDDFVLLLTKESKKIANAKLQAIGKNYFEKTGGGDVRALIVNVEARDLIRIVLDDEAIRLKTDISDFSILTQSPILEDAFEHNVRVYLRQRTKINQNIKATAQSEEDSSRFFYFNNGITITYSHYYYEQRHSPIITLENLQVVNGGQTIHALYEAFKEKPEQFEYIDLLVRIYETQNTDLSTKIAEYTNSQNPVTSRDIRSIDLTQQKLEKELAAKGYFYERKKNFYVGAAKDKRIDAMKAGQVLFAFFNKLPNEAKNSKRRIFADRYEEIFNEEVTADKILLAHELFNRIEHEKTKRKKEILDMTTDINAFDRESYILYASYHILYILREMADRQGIVLHLANIDKIWAMYENADNIVKEIIDRHKQATDKTQTNYTHPYFFKSSKPKEIFVEKYANT